MYIVCCDLLSLCLAVLLLQSILIRFLFNIAGAVTSPPLALSNSRPHTPALMNAVGSSLASRVEAASEEADLKKAKRTSGSGLDVPSFPAKGISSLFNAKYFFRSLDNNACA